MIEKYSLKVPTILALVSFPNDSICSRMYRKKALLFQRPFFMITLSLSLFKRRSIAKLARME